MDVLEYCQSHHLRDDINNLDLHLRLCRFCCKAMCKACFDVHKNHCSGQTQWNKRNANDITSTSGGPNYIKKSKLSKYLEPNGASSSSPQLCSSSETPQPPNQRGNTSSCPSCSVHSLSEDQFCVSHCSLVCSICHSEHHTSCTVKSVTNVCGNLDHTAVTEYKKSLNTLHVSGIEIKTLLGRNLENAEKHKITALHELQKTFSKAIENLNCNFLNVKSEIEKAADNHFSEIQEKISKLEEINDRL